MDPITVSDITKVATAWTITATSAGDTTVKAPASGKKLRVKLIDVWNNGTGDCTVYLRFGSAGTPRFMKTIAPKTGFVINLIGANWEGAAGESLIINLSEAGNVAVTCMGDEL